MSLPRKTRVAVVFGGRSTEHAISCVSAGNILGAIDSDEFEIVPIGITREGRWVLTTGDGLQIEGRQLPDVAKLPVRPGITVVEPSDGMRGLTDVDVVFPVLHGAFGEDGTVQGLLEMAGLPYVGSGVFASAAAMDKEFGKKLADNAGIPVGPHVVLRAGQTIGEADMVRLGLPVFVKPARAGSSFGISKVRDWDDLDRAVAEAREVDPKVLVEAAIVGREIEVGVLEGEHGGPPEASVPAEIRIPAGHEFFDFDAKYLDDVADFDVPADLPSSVAERVRRYAVQAFTALDCAGLARVDFFVTPSFEIYLNEINTMPGFTRQSLFPMMWSASGLEYPKLVSRLINTALARGTGLH
jgi:D-alanine-D-alanine ligase